MTIPDILSGWNQWLQWFAQEMQDDVSQLLHHLTPLLTAPRPVDDGGLMTAAGLETVRQRGDYANLLLSEWMLADEVPDEFLRRAIHHEHLFFTPPPYEEEGGKRVFALFDAGPMQLGLPRCAHIALMILLARRALMIEGAFHWGIVQQKPEGLDFSSDKDLRSLLAARNGRLVDKVMLERWRDYFATAEKGDECWLIGSRDSTLDGCALEANGQANFATHVLTINDTFDGDWLQIALTQKNRPRLEIHLPLPSENMCQRLLSGRFVVSAQKQSRVSKTDLLSQTTLLSPITIAPTGRHIMLRLRNNDEGFVELVMKGGRIKVRRWSLPQGARIVAAGYDMQNRLYMLLEQYGSHRIWTKDNSFSKETVRLLDADSLPKGQNRLQPLVVMSLDADKRYVYRLDDARNLTVIEAGPVLAEKQLARDVHAIEHRRLSQMLVLQIRDGNWHIVGKNPVEEVMEFSRSLGETAPFGDVFIYRQDNAKGSRFGALFQKDSKSSSCWFSRTLGSDDRDDDIEVSYDVPDSCKVIGAYIEKDSDFITPVLWDRQSSIGVWSGNRFQRWFHAPVKIARVEMCPSSGIIVMLGIDHQVFIFDSNEQELVRAVHTKEKAA